ncbi:MAG: hypothetical protein KF753_08085 [Caldilineaceae bacterium]|nr:hypothetical protein [Caldilineaceae bacterium]
MAEELDALAAIGPLTGQIRLGESLPSGARIRLRSRVTGQPLPDSSAEIGPNGLFRLEYDEAFDRDSVVVEVVDRLGNLLADAAAFPHNNPDQPYIFTVDGLRPIEKGEGYEIPTTPPHAEVYWRTKFPLPHEQLTRSQDALERLRTVWDSDNRGDAMDGRVAYPWQLQINPTTSLPTVVRAQLPIRLPPTGAVEAVRENLSQGDLSQAIFGIDLGARFDETFRAQVPVHLASGSEGRGLEQNSHLIWRQIYSGPDGTLYPVLGGGFRVHGRTNAVDVAITNSFYPLTEVTLDLHVKLTDEEILEQALAALLAMPEIEDRASILTELWRRVQPRQGPLAFLNRLRPLLHWLGLARSRQVPVQVMRDKYYLPTGRDLPNGEGDEAYSLAIIPVAGQYHLAARVRLMKEGWDVWYVDVDVQSGVVVGRPWQPTSHAPFYATSQNAAEGPPPQGDFPINAFGFPAEPAPPLLDLPAAGAVDDRERATVAVHSQRLYDHLCHTCGAKAELEAHVQAGYRIKVVLEAEGRTQFNYAHFLPSKEVRFQQGSDVGILLDIAGNQRHLFHPARDPEVIMHEMTHAFFWLINRDPWEEQNVVSPFGRALHEGYAIYLARSVAAGDDAAENDKPWARGMYREEWGDRWRLLRSQRKAGADFLRMPNQYPGHRFALGFENIELEDYDIGMIWARALWDLRQLLGPAETDFLVVQGYPYLHGSIANFETAAQGLIEADIRGEQFNAEAAVKPIFSTRGLMSSTGTFGFAQSGGGALIAATDLGIQLRTAGGWVADTTPGIDAIAGVASLAAGDGRLYVVAVPPRAAQITSLPPWRTGLYQRENNQWTEIGAPDHTALGVYALPTASGNRLFIATTGGVYWIENGSPARLGNTQDEHPVHDLLVWNGPGSPSRLLMAARSDKVAAVDLDSVPPGNPGAAVWNSLPVGDQLRVAALAVRQKSIAGAVAEEELYVGTVDGGIWRYGANDEFHPTNLTAQPDAAILALTAREARLVWSTPEGVGWSTDGETAMRLALPCPSALVVSLHLQADGILFAGTFAHGIWRVNLNEAVPAWHAERLPASQAQQQIPPSEQKLLSYFHAQPSPTAQLVIQGDVAVRRVSQPGFPLALRQPDANQQYVIEQGWVILLVSNPTATPLRVTAAADDNGNIRVTATV